jgi:FkbM family methyltransferase
MQKSFQVNSLPMIGAVRWLNDRYKSAYLGYRMHGLGLDHLKHLNLSDRDFLTRYLPALKNDNLVVYDIGAAKGLVSKCLAQLPNVTSVQSFEPLPHVYAELQKMTQPYPKVQCHNVALGNETGFLAMNVCSKTDSSSLLPMAKLHLDQFPDRVIATQTKVISAKLDDYVKQQNLPSPTVLKIDVQGFEKNVISGGKSTISQADYCILEMSFHSLYENSPLFDEIYRLMCDLGFRLVGVSSPLVGKSGDHLQVDGIFKNLHCSN